MKRRGVLHPAAKLDEGMAQRIFYAKESSRVTARQYGVSDGLIRKLRQRGYWGNWRASRGRAV